MKMENSFKNVFDESYERKNSFGFKNRVLIPFVSGVLGCSVVIGTCFGVPQIKSKILGTTTTPTSSSTSSFSDTHAGTVDFVSLASYSDTAVYAANKILPSIVGIEVTYNVTQDSMFSFFGTGSRTTSEAKASGSGIIISEDGYILTNNHVVDSKSQSMYYDISEATSVKVTLSTGDNKTYEAKIVGKDSQTDLAVLKIEATGLIKAEFANSDAVKIGEFSMAVGNPLALGTTITCGVVSAVNREVDDDENKNKFKCIQTDAAINSGNSGGALVNSKGQVIGVNTLKVSSTGVEGIGFAIPINSTLNVIEELKTYSKVRRPFIGIGGRNITEDIAKAHNLVQGIYVSSVEQFSSAEKAGIKIGDVITAIDGTQVKTMDELNEIKNKHKIGDTITLKVYRDGKTMDITLNLGESN